ncbi:MAG: helix-turn-helix transcriptional regulator [Chloroflexi bacterium]|jgi:XRE family transcriptional regulator, regulator of sulfur utilization|nr:helix-turn-helix transcriptional regulator [Chloroflexota bacterium]
MPEAGLLRKFLGQRIRQLRKARDWTQQELAERAGLDYKYVGAIERGERNITIDNVEKIAAGLGLEAHQLFLFSAVAEEMPEERVTDEKIQDLLEQGTPDRKQLMWRILRELAVWEAD